LPVTRASEPLLPPQPLSDPEPDPSNVPLATRFVPAATAVEPAPIATTASAQSGASHLTRWRRIAPVDHGMRNLSNELEDRRGESRLAARSRLGPAFDRGSHELLTMVGHAEVGHDSGVDG
jgi:hypothetical protein